jgi:hypothetical protein
MERAADKRLFLWYNHNLKSVRTVIPAKAGTPNLTVNLMFTHHVSFSESTVREPPNLTVNLMFTHHLSFSESTVRDPPNLTVNLMFTHHLSFSESTVREPPTSPSISCLLIT